MPNPQSKFKIVERSRTMITYPMTDNEIKSIGALTLVEQILMNICSLFGGAGIGGLISFLSDKDNLLILTVTIVSGASFLVSLMLLIVIMVIVRKQKKGIFGN